jgi:hypothetical protein
MSSDTSNLDSTEKTKSPEAPSRVATQIFIDYAENISKADYHYNSELKADPATTAQQLSLYESLSIPVLDAYA